MKQPEAPDGLRGRKVGRTAISHADAGTGRLSIRGYDVETLATEAAYEETAWLLLQGDLPGEQELDEFCHRLHLRSQMPPTLARLLEEIPADADPVDVLRSGVSLLGSLEPESGFGAEDVLGERLLALMPAMLAHWYRYTHHGQLTETMTRDDLLAARLVHGITGRAPGPDAERAIDAMLTLYADHEFNASTFACRVCAATRSDLYSAICAGIGTLKGPLHGGAIEGAMALIAAFDSPDEAERGVRDMLANGQRVMGFGHAVWRHGDPRTAIARDWSRRLAAQAADGHCHAVAERIATVMASERGLQPNLDFYSATTFHFAGLPAALFTSVFACARVCGWCAHVREQRADNRLIHPDAEYIGPGERSFVPLEGR